MLKTVNEFNSETPKGDASKSLGGLETLSATRQSEPARTVTGFEATTSEASAEALSPSRAEESERDVSALSIGFFRKRKLVVWIWAKRVEIKAGGRAEDCLNFEIDADRGLTGSMLLKLILSKIDVDTYEVDSSKYEVRFQDTDNAGATIKADFTSHPITADQLVFQLNVKCLVLVCKTTDQIGANPLLRIKTRVGMEEGEHARGRLPTLSQLSPEELEEYSRRETLTEKRNVCAIRLAVSPLCIQKLIGSTGKGSRSLLRYIPSSILIQARPTFSVKNVIELFLDSICEGKKSQWTQWVIKKTSISIFHSNDERSSFWMHKNHLLGDVLDVDDKVVDVVPWQTVVLLPRTSKDRLVRKSTQTIKSALSKGSKVTYLFTEQTASMYVEYNVVKVNRHGKKEQRILGIDREKIYNLLPRLELDSSPGTGFERQDSESPSGNDFSLSKISSFGSKGSSSKKKTTTKKRTREVKQVAKCKVTEEKDEVACLIYKDGSRYYFEFSNEDTCAEAVARINYLKGLS